MIEKKTYCVWVWRLFLSIAFWAFCTGQAVAQPSNNVFSSKLLHDTLTAVGNKEFLFNTATITNTTGTRISMIVKVAPPAGWSLVSPKQTALSLDPYETSIVSMRLLPSTSRTAEWEKVTISYLLNENAIETTDSFGVRVREYLKFRATLLNSNIILPGYQKTVTFPIFVKNLGNIVDNYSVKYSNDRFQLNQTLSFSLPPGKDTTFNVVVKLTENDWSMLRNETVRVNVYASNDESYTLSQYISKIGAVLKENSTSYLDVPLQLEAGAMYQGDDNFQYYGGLRGTLDITPTDRVALELRSNTYAPGQVINNSIARIEYTGEHWKAFAGNLMELTDFFVDGYGGKLGYRWDEFNKVQVFGMLKSRIGDSKLFGSNISYSLGQKMTGTNALAANFNNVTKNNAYIARQGLDYLFDEAKGHIHVLGGIGMEQTRIQLAGNAKQQMLGSEYGYNFSYADKRFSIVSNLNHKSNSFPGIYKGQRLQIHDVRLMRKDAFAGAFYEYSFRKQNIFLDTNFIQNIFNLKTTNFGIRSGYNYKGNNIIVAAAQQEQQMPLDAATPTYIFRYLQVNLALHFWEHLHFVTNTYIGQGYLAELKGTKAPVISNQASVQYKFAGTSVRYDKGPLYFHEMLAYTREPGNYGRLILSPHIDIPLPKQNIGIRTQLNYTKSQPNGFEYANLLGNFRYNNAKRGFEFNFSGIVPLKKNGSNYFLNTSFNYMLRAPFVFVRKYYDVKLILFKDKNGNGIYDPGEEPVPDQMLAMNKNLFITDAKGTALFENVAKGTFKMDFGYTSKLKGWIPIKGTLQTFDIAGNRTLYIAYKKSKVIQGKLTLATDNYSNLTFSVANIKVTATTGKDSLVSYSTITDENGEFYFNVPDGNYMVTLSEVAFDENFRPAQPSLNADMINNDEKTLNFEIRQKKRQINIKKK